MQNFTRKRIRLNSYDYSADGAYFVTVCTDQKRCLLGSIAPDGEDVSLSACGEAVRESIMRLPAVFGEIHIPIYVIMPNHVHMIVHLEHQTKTLSQIINYFKGNVTRKLHTALWQRSFYEHVIRNEKDYDEIAEYIALNPRRWALDRYYSVE